LGCAQVLLEDSQGIKIIEAQGSMDPGEFLHLARSERNSLRDLLRTHGAIYFKGFQQTLDSFNDFMDILFPELEPFDTGRAGIFANRRPLARNVLESTYLGPRIPLAVHNEFSYLSRPPRYVSFRCLKAPDAGGETALGDCRRIHDEIDPAIRNKFESRKIRYVRNLYERRLVSSLVNKFEKIDESWMEVFRTDSRERVEGICCAEEMTFHWQSNNALTITNVLPAIRRHPETGQAVWFNQAANWVAHPKISGWLKFLATHTLYPTRGSRPIQVSFGDGSSISVRDAFHIFEVIKRNTVFVQWSAGDTLLCDNYLVSHGRTPYTGERLLATAMR
jgi:alpha-ketoglutarate-dependent taurine dioxygenase